MEGCKKFYSSDFSNGSNQRHKNQKIKSTNSKCERCIYTKLPGPDS